MDSKLCAMDTELQHISAANKHPSNAKKGQRNEMDFTGLMGWLVHVHRVHMHQGGKDEQVHKRNVRHVPQ